MLPTFFSFPASGTQYIFNVPNAEWTSKHLDNTVSSSRNSVGKKIKSKLIKDSRNV